MANLTFKINDVVKVKRLGLNHTEIKKGNVGAVIEIFQEHVLSSYEVEFIDGQGKLVDILTLSSSQLEKFDLKG